MIYSTKDDHDSTLILVDKLYSCSSSSCINTNIQNQD